MICRINISRIKDDNGYIYVSVADIGNALDIKSNTLHTRARKADINLLSHEGKSYIRTDDLTKIVSLIDEDINALESLDKGFETIYNSLLGEIDRLNKEVEKRDDIIKNVKALLRGI